MNTQREFQSIETVAYQIWEEWGRIHGHHEDHWAEAQRRLSAADSKSNGAKGHLNVSESKRACRTDLPD